MTEIKETSKFLNIGETFKDSQQPELGFQDYIVEPENWENFCNQINIILNSPNTSALFGSKKLDILCIDESIKNVVIELMQGKLDYDHLGKGQVYSTGYNTEKTIFICEAIEPEMRATIDDINIHTDETKNIYVVFVKFIKVGNSKPIPIYSLICEPNELERNVNVFKNKYINTNNSNSKILKDISNDVVSQLGDNWKYISTANFSAIFPKIWIDKFPMSKYPSIHYEFTIKDDKVLILIHKEGKKKEELTIKLKNTNLINNKKVNIDNRWTIYSEKSSIENASKNMLKIINETYKYINTCV